MGKQRKQWTAEQKLTIVLAALRDEQSIAELSRQYGVGDNLIYQWKAQFLEGGRQALGSVKSKRPDQRLQALEVKRERVKGVALSHPTYGYRPVHQALKSQGEAIGRERIRCLLRDLGLQQRRPKKTHRHAVAVTESVDFPPGRRVQIDATRLRLDDGVAWIYLVEDVLSRACLSVSVGHRLSQERTALALQEGRQILTAHGVTEPLVIQNDAAESPTRPWEPRASRRKPKRDCTSK